LDAQAPLPTPTFSESAPADTAKIQENIIKKAESVKIPTDRELKDLVEDDNTYLEWLVDIKAEKHANNGDFVVHVFLGDPRDENPTVYILNHNHVAAFTPLGQSVGTGCGKCLVDQAQRIEVTGQIPLTLALAERYQAGLLDSLRPADIEPFLAKNLHWRVANKNSQLVPRDQIEGLLVGVVTCKVTLPTDGSLFPQYADEVVPRPNATTKKQEDWSNGQPVGRGDGTGYTGGAISSVAG